MHIAIVMLDKNFGGIQRAFVDYSIELACRGFSILCLVRDGSIVEKELLEHGVSSVSIIRNRFGFCDTLAIRSLTKQLTQFFANAQQCFVLTIGARAALFASKARLRNSSWKVAALLPNSINFKYYQYVDILIPPTKAMSSAGYHQNTINPNFSEIVPHFCRTAPAIKVQAAHEPVNLFAAGRLVQKKGFNYLLEAISKLASAYPRIVLKVAGDGPETDKLMGLRDNFELQTRVEFLGYREDVPSLIAQSDLLIVPSVVEPFGIILLEGMAVGTPIVTTRTAGATELLDNSSARFADIASSDSLAEAIADAIDDPQSANERAVAALNCFKRQYTPDVVIPKMISVLERFSVNTKAT